MRDLTQRLPLIEVSHPAIRHELAYATAQNLTGRVLYSHDRSLLRAETARALYGAADHFAALGLEIVLLDAYRPVSVQRALWATLPDPDFVANPVTGSDHSRGIAVDLTLTRAGAAPGERLEMGTHFDAPVVQSHHGRSDIPEAAIANRLMLKAGMEAAGFVHNPLEWWHYNLPRGPQFPLLDDAL